MSTVFRVMMVLLSISFCAHADRMDSYQIGGHDQVNVRYPGWFKESFLDLRDDLVDAKDADKRGIIVYFSQKNCNHCKAFISTTFSDPEIQKRVQAQYDVIALDIFSDVELTYIDGSTTTVKNFADLSRARLTPTLLFFGVENKPLLKIVGFYPPEKFGQVLDYIEGHHYQREKLSQYLRHRKMKTESASEKLSFDHELFERPPHALDAGMSGRRMLLVLFETPSCGPCDRFRQRVLSDPEVRTWMKKYRTVQLDASDDLTKITTPDGQIVTPKQWHDRLQLAYDVAVVFFDENGKEVHRLDSETGQTRMAGSLQYVQERAYERHEQFLQWRKEQALKSASLQRKSDNP